MLALDDVGDPLHEDRDDDAEARRKQHQRQHHDRAAAQPGIVISIFMERIADIVEGQYYPELGKARGIPIWTGSGPASCFCLPSSCSIS